jgi:hypothetical protein
MAPETSSIISAQDSLLAKVDRIIHEIDMKCESVMDCTKSSLDETKLLPAIPTNDCSEDLNRINLLVSEWDTLYLLLHDDNYEQNNIERDWKLQIDLAVEKCTDIIHQKLKKGTRLERSYNC